MSPRQPQPKSRASGGAERRRRPFGVALFWASLAVATLVVLLVAAPFLLVRVTPVRDALLDIAAEQAGLGPDLRLRVEEIGSLHPGRLRLRDIRVERRAPEGEWRPLARVGTFTAGLEIEPLLKRRLHLRAVAADSVALHLEQLRGPASGRRAQAGGRTEAGRATGDGRFIESWRIPSLGGVAHTIGLIPRLSIGTLHLSRVSIADSAGVLLEGALQLADLRSEPRGISSEVRDGEVRWPRLELGLRVRQGALHAARDGLLEVRGLLLELGESRATVQARHDPAVEDLPFSAHLTLQRLTPQPLAERYLPELRWEPNDSLSGEIELQFGPGRLRGSVLLAGRLRDEALEEVAGRIEATGPRVVLSDLHLKGDPGELHARGHWDLERSRGEAGLDWRGLSLQSAWLPWLRDLPLSAPLSGSATAEIEWPRGGKPRLVGEARVRDADPWDIPVRECRAVGRADLADGFVSGDVQLRLAQGEILASGDWPLDDRPVAVTARIDSLDLGQLPAAWVGEASGRVTGEVDLEGPARALLLRGRLDGESLGWGPWRADSLEVREAWLALADLSGAGKARARGVRSGEDAPFDLEASLAREEGTASGEFRVRHPLGELSGAGAVDPDRALALERLRLESADFGDWELAAPFHARWDGQRITTDSLRIAGPRGRLCAALHWQGRGGALEAGARLSGFDLGLLRPWIPGADTLRGRADLSLSARGALPDPELSVRLSVAGIGYGPFEASRALLNAGWSGETLALDGSIAVASGGEIRIPGIRLETRHPLAAWLGLDRPRVEPVPLERLLDCPLHGAIETDSLVVAGFAPLLGPLAAAVGEGENGGSRIYVGGEVVPVTIVTPWDPPRSQAPPGVGGSLRAGVEIEGTPRRPQLRLEARADGLRFAQVELGRLTLVATYADSLVRLGDLRLQRGGHTSWARGYYPLALSLAPFELRRLDREAAIQIEVDSLGLGFVSRLTRYVPDATGSLAGQATLSGSGLRPDLRGNLTLTGGGMRIPQRSERLYDIEATLVLVPGGVEVRSLDGRTGPRGTVTGVGSYTFPDQFDFTGVVQQARIYEEGQYEFVANASLNAFSTGTGRSLVPRLNGAVEVLSGTITQNLSEKEAPPAAGQAIPWIIDLDVDAPGSIQVSQINAKAEVGEGRLHLAFRWPYWNASGSLRVLGGTYRLLNNTFTVTEGTVEFRDTGQGPDLSLAVEAETSVAVAGEEEGPSETVTVTVTVNGKPEALEVSLSSEPQLSEEEIVELLSYGRFTRTGRFEAASETQWILLNTMVDRIETSLIAQSPLFTRVGIAPGSSGDEPLRLTWRPVVTPSFQVNYAQELALDPEMDLSVNYRLSRVLYLRAGVARDRRAAGSFSDEYSLDLKCRFEYE